MTREKAEDFLGGTWGRAGGIAGQKRTALRLGVASPSRMTHERRNGKKADDSPD